MWKITHAFKFRGQTFTQTVTLPIVVSVNKKKVVLGSAFAAEAYYAGTLGNAFEHVQIDAEEVPDGM